MIMSCWTKEQLENMLEDVVNELNLSDVMIESLRSRSQSNSIMREYLRSNPYADSIMKSPNVSF